MASTKKNTDFWRFSHRFFTRIALLSDVEVHKLIKLESTCTKKTYYNGVRIDTAKPVCEALMPCKSI